MAATIAELLQTGRLALLDRLHGRVDPVTLFSALPGVGTKTAQAIADMLHVDTLFRGPGGISPAPTMPDASDGWRGRC